MEKPTKYSVALVIYNSDRSKFFVTKRPPEDESMPNYWGFPAASKLTPEENWEETVNRAAKTKLGVEVEIKKYLGEDSIERENYFLILRDYEVEIKNGEPKVPQSEEGVTQYTEQKWTDETAELERSARDGSLCSRIFLRSNNINWE